MPIGFALLNIPVPDMGTVINNANNNWLPHYNTSGYKGAWDVLTLRSPGGDLTNINAEPLGWGGYADTVRMQSFPLIKKLVGSLDCEIMSVRLLNLRSGAVVKQHRDVELAFEKGEVRLHFPIVTNDAVEFYVNDVRLTMRPGQCWYVNANLPHRVSNYGLTDRIHLVIDCKVNEWIEKIFGQADKAEFEETVDDSHTLMVIQSLRLLQTATANELADKLEKELSNIK